MNADAQTLSITITDAGAVQVNGPLDDKMLCYALLECAKDAVRDFKKPAETKPEPRIQPPSPTDIRALTATRPR